MIGFFFAHLMFAWYAFERFAFSRGALIACLILLAGYIVYMALRMLPRVAKGLKLPLTLYMLVSLLSLYCALSMGAAQPEKALYAVGIGAIVFSDTMIGESEFAGVEKAHRLVLPTYYLCHVLIALSTLVR